MTSAIVGTPMNWAVLVLDDEHEALVELKDMIARDGYQVFIAASVDEARQALDAQSEIAVIVSDIRFPGSSGLEFLKEVSQRQGRYAVRTIMVTGYASYDSVVQALRSRAFDFLSKPLSRDVLLQSIRDAMTEVAHMRGSLSDDAVALRNILRKRETRAILFNTFDYSEAAWDILIELTAARLQNRRLDVSGLCLLTHVSRTTAWRTIQNLVSAGMLVRIEDPVDRRRVYVELLDDVFNQMHEFAKMGAV